MGLIHHISLSRGQILISFHHFFKNTPLVLNPVGSTIITYNQHPSDEYFIGVTSIKVNGKDVQFNKTLLSIDQNGFGGTKISTVVPYTVLETSIYKAFTATFVSESAALNLTAVTDPVKPFAVCYSAGDVMSTRIGLAVPTVDLVMQRNNHQINDDVFRRMFGADSKEDVWCLGFVDGGVGPRASVVIGGNQIEDNLLQFEVGVKRLGFNSSVLVHGTTCYDFNFTSCNNNS